MYYPGATQMTNPERLFKQVCGRCNANYDIFDNAPFGFSANCARVRREKNGVRIEVITGKQSWNSIILCPDCITNIITNGLPNSHYWPHKRNNTERVVSTTTFMTDQEYTLMTLRGNFETVIRWGASILWRAATNSERQRLEILFLFLVDSKDKNKHTVASRLSWFRSKYKY